MSVISKENKKKLVSIIDELAKFKNPLLETADGMVFTIVFNVIDDNLLSKTKPEYHPLIDRVAGEIGDKNFLGASDTLAEIATMAVETPLVDGTPEEEEIYKNAFRILTQLVEFWINKA